MSTIRISRSTDMVVWRFMRSIYMLGILDLEDSGYGEDFLVVGYEEPGFQYKIIEDKK